MELVRELKNQSTSITPKVATTIKINPPKKRIFLKLKFVISGPERIRTADLQGASLALYQLSYGPGVAILAYFRPKASFSKWSKKSEYWQPTAAKALGNNEVVVIPGNVLVSRT